MAHRHNGCRPIRRTAFTLLELIIVVTIAAMMAGLAVPALRKTYEASVRNATARDFIGLCRYARSQSVVKQHEVNIFIDLDTQEYWVDVRRDLDSAPTTKKSGMLGNSKFAKKGTKTIIEEKRLPGKNVFFGEVSTYERQILSDKLIALDFFPDGSASPATITFVAKSGDQQREIIVDLQRASGSATIKKRGEIDAEAEKGVATPMPGISRAGSSSSW